MTKRVYLYAFNDVLEIVDTKFLEDDAISVLNIRRLANWMRDTYPEPVVIYAVGGGLIEVLISTERFIFVTILFIADARCM